MALWALWPYLRVGACPRREAVTGVLVGIGVLMDVVELVCVVSDKSVVGGVIRGGARGSEGASSSGVIKMDGAVLSRSSAISAKIISCW